MEQEYTDLTNIPSADFSLTLEPELALFYTRIAATAGVSLHQVLHDALFRLAGELSLEALKNNSEKHCN